MNIAILTSVRDTMENVEVRRKENMLRMIACMNAIEQLIQEESKPVPEQPAEQPQAEEVPAEQPQAEEVPAETPEGTTEGVVADGE